MAFTTLVPLVPLVLFNGWRRFVVCAFLPSVHACPSKEVTGIRPLESVKRGKMDGFRNSFRPSVPFSSSPLWLSLAKCRCLIKLYTQVLSIGWPWEQNENTWLSRHRACPGCLSWTWHMPRLRLFGPNLWAFEACGRGGRAFVKLEMAASYDALLSSHSDSSRILPDTAIQF